MSSVGDATRFRRREQLRAVDMDGELVMMGQEQGEYYGLKDVAASIWRHLDTPRTVSEICALVSAEYEVGADDCRDDVEAFLQDLVAKRMVDPAN